nr:MAG TPA: hypothetical protein [Caudoviricetes sp.]
MNGIVSCSFSRGRGLFSHLPLIFIIRQTTSLIICFYPV